jgi:ubiquinone/menaquinone biosynthesis C-methylase UbiE
MPHEHGHRHEHGGRSSKFFMKAEPVLEFMGVSEGSNFFDAGTGDGFFALAASTYVGSTGKVYAVDIFEEGLEALRLELREKKITNVEVHNADLTKELPLEDSSSDFCLLSNILHGFVENGEVEPVFKNLNRVLKPGAVLGIVEFKKVESHGPPLEVRLDASEVEAVVSKYGYEKAGEADIAEFQYAVKFIKG